MHNVFEDFTASGRNDPNLTIFAKRNSVLSDMHFLLDDRPMLVSMFNKEPDCGEAVESSSSLSPAQGGSVLNAVGAASSTTAYIYDTKAKRSTHAKTTTLETIAKWSATMATASRKLTASMTA